MSFTFSGGIMTSEEAAIFEKCPLFDTCLRMRELDEASKVVGKMTPPFSAYKPLIVSALRNPKCKVDQCHSSFARNGSILVGLDLTTLVLA